jgi:hypothetical protein
MRPRDVRDGTSGQLPRVRHNLQAIWTTFEEFLGVSRGRKTFRGRCDPTLFAYGGVLFGRRTFTTRGFLANREKAVPEDLLTGGDSFGGLFHAVSMQSSKKTQQQYASLMLAYL